MIKCYDMLYLCIIFIYSIFQQQRKPWSTGFQWLRCVLDDPAIRNFQADKIFRSLFLDDWGQPVSSQKHETLQNTESWLSN